MGLSPYNRPDPWLRQTDDPPWNAVSAGFKHEALLFIYCRHQVHAVLLGLRQYDAALHIFDNVSHISANVLKLLPNCLPNYLCSALFPLYLIQIVFSGPFSIRSGLLQPVAVTHLVYDAHKLFSDTVQQLDILWIRNICRAAGGVHGQRTPIGWILIIIIPVRVSRTIRLGNGSFQNFGNVFRAEPLAERHHCGCSKGATASVFLHADEILQIWVLTDVLDNPLIAAFQTLFDQQSAKGHPRRVRGVSIIHKLRCVPLFYGVPGNQCRQLHPIIFWVQRSIREYEILYLQLAVILIHVLHHPNASFLRVILGSPVLLLYHISTGFPCISMGFGLWSEA